MKALRKAMSILLVSALLASCLPLSVFAAELPFSDVKKGDWYYDAVCYVYENGLMSGTSGSVFSPDVTTSRGMIVTILYSLEGKPAAAGADFADVASEAYYAKAVGWASANGIVTGYGGGRFGPDDPITREQLAMILYRYAEYKGLNTTVLGDSISFADRNAISSYAVKAIDWALGFGLLSGVGENRLNPAGSATRAQAAVILMRFNTVEQLWGTQSTPTPEETPEPTPEVTPTVTPTPTGNVDGYAICELALTDGTVQAVVSAEGDCRLLVAVLTEEGVEVTRALTTVAGGAVLDDITVALPKVALPDYFLLCGVLLDAEGNELCSPFTCRSYTKAYALFSAQKESDFDADRVIDVMEADDGNFVLLQEDVVRIEQSDAVNVLRSRGDGVCVFDNGDAALRGMKKGDKLLLRDLDGQYAAILIEDITVSDGAVTITEAADTTLSDFYSVIKISADLIGQPSAADGDIVKAQYLAAETSTKDKKYLSKITFGPAVSDSIETPFGSVEVELAVGGKLEINYDIKIFGDSYLEYVMLVGITGEMALDIGPNKQVEDELEIMSIPLAGLKNVAEIPAEISLAYEVDADAGLGMTVSVESVTGCVYHTGDGVQQVKYKEVVQREAEVKGSAEVEIGLRASINAKVLDGMVKASLGAEGGVILKGELVELTWALPDSDSYHACGACVDGDVTGYFEVEISAKFEICDWLKGDILDLDLLRVNWEIGVFYFSLINEEDSVHKGWPTFDWGSCPNNKYRVTVEAYQNGKKVNETAKLSRESESFSGMAGQQLEEKETLYSLYLYPGTYVASADIGIQHDSKCFTVEEDSMTVKLEVEDPGLHGFVTDEDSGEPIENLYVSLVGPEDKTAEVSLGFYEVQVKPGDYTVTCGAEGYETETMDITLLKNREQSFTLKKKQPILSGTVTDKENGDPIGGAVITLTKDGKTLTAASGSDGRYSVQVEAGYYKLTCSAEDYKEQSVSSLKLMDNTTRGFSLEKNYEKGIVSGVVTDENTGEPLFGVVVKVAEDSKIDPAITDTLGTYKLELNAEKDYTLSFSKEGYEDAAADVTVVPEETVTVDMAMKTMDERGIYTKYLLNGGYKKLFPSGQAKYADIRTNYGDFDGNGIKDLLLYYADTQWSGPRGYQTYTVLYTIDESTWSVVEVCQYYYGGGTMGGDYLTLYRNSITGAPQLSVDSTYREGIWKAVYGDVVVSYSGQTATEGDRFLTRSYSTDETSFYKDEIEEAKKGIHYIDDDGYYLRVYTVNEEVVTKEAFEAANYLEEYPEDSALATYEGTYYEPIRPAT